MLTLLSAGTILVPGSEALGAALEPALLGAENGALVAAALAGALLVVAAVGGALGEGVAALLAAGLAGALGAGAVVGSSAAAAEHEDPSVLSSLCAYKVKLVITANLSMYGQ